jgi:hypothetical protein
MYHVIELETYYKIPSIQIIMVSIRNLLSSTPLLAPIPTTTPTQKMKTAK